MKLSDSPKPSRPEGEPSAAGTDESQRRRLGRAVGHSALPLREVWLDYYSMGGTAGEWELDAYINGLYSLPVLERDILAQAVNEMIDMIPPPPRASYSDDTNDCGAPSEEGQR